jgi:hypothetical protein
MKMSAELPLLPGHFHESGTYYWPDPDILSPRAPAAAAHAD